jgi:predicted ATP-binding protein involved in virulence
MRILEQRLKNFRCFKECSPPLAPRFSLLTGDNGIVKTEMLDALSVAAGSLLLGIPVAVLRPINKDEIRAVNLVLGQTVSDDTIRAFRGSVATVLVNCPPRSLVPGTNEHEPYTGNTDKFVAN